MKWMPVREFIRGGYRTLTETTIVSLHGRPLFTVIPYRRDTATMIVDLDRAEGGHSSSTFEPKK